MRESWFGEEIYLFCSEDFLLFLFSLIDAALLSATVALELSVFFLFCV